MLLDHLLVGVRAEGCVGHSVQLREVRFRSCIGCEQCRADKSCTGLRDGMQALYPEIVVSRGMILVSPAHHYNVTALMKGFIDRLYCFYEFAEERPGPWSSRLAGQGRKAVIAAVCEQETQAAGMGFTLDAMRLPLEALGYEIVDRLAVYGVFERGGIAARPEVLARAESVGRRLALRLQTSG